MIEVKYKISLWIPDDEEWKREGSFKVSEAPQAQSLDVASALWHGPNDNWLGTVHKSICGELSELVANRIAKLASIRHASDQHRQGDDIDEPRIGRETAQVP